MRHRVKFIALAVIAIFVFSSEALAIYLPTDIRPADQYSDPADYTLIFMDRDGWELRMNEVEDTTYAKRFTGILLYGYGSCKYVGDLEAVYYKTEEVLMVTCTDPGWHNYTLSYALHRRHYFRMYGNYLYFEQSASNWIYADIVKGKLGEMEPYHGY
jgi:hypothetical protein